MIDSLPTLPIVVVCTDGGRHKPRAFGKRAEDWCGDVLRVNCPNCPRDARIRMGVLRKIAQAYAEVGWDTLDVSAMASW